MTDDNQLYDQIDRYLRGELKADDAFVQRLQYDKELALEVEVQKLVGQATVDYKLMEVEKIVERYRENAIKPNIKSTQWIWQSLIAVGIGALVCYYAFVFEKPKPIVSETIPAGVAVKPIEDINVEQGKKSSKKEVLAKNIPSITPKKQETASNSVVVPKQPIGVTEEKAAAPIDNLKEIKEAHIPIVQPEVLELKKVESIPTPLPCHHVVIKAYVGETKPCNGANNGLLSIESIRGGTAPYSFSLDKGKTFQGEHVFSHLHDAYYDILVKDAKGCESYVTQQHHLKARLCVTVAEHSFNPHIETWELPNDIEKTGEISIVSKEGKQVYLRSFGLNERISWDGSALNGPLLTSGVYIYHIKYSDGTTEQGKITLSY